MQITNETHWRTSDIKRVLKAVLKRIGAAEKNVPEVTVKWQARNASKATVKIHDVLSGPEANIYLFLPKKGPKNHHQNAMMAVACSAAETGDSEVLAFQEVFRVVNLLAYKLIDPLHLTVTGSVEDEDALLQAVGTISKPDWTPIESFQIQKYKDPLKDGTYLDFVAKKEREVRRAVKDIERETERKAKAEHRIKLAEDRKKKAQKALRDARARRTS